MLIVNTSDVTKMEPNKFALEALRAKNNRANIKFKHELENTIEMPSYQWEPATKQLLRKPFNIDDVNWRNQVYSEVNTTPMAGAMGVAVMPTRLQHRQYDGTLDNFIKSADAKKLGIDPVLAQDVLNTLKAEKILMILTIVRILKLSFGVHTNKLIMITKHSKVSQDLYQNQRDNVAKSTVRSLLSGNGTFYRPGSSVSISNTHKEVSEDELVDDKGNPRKDLYLRRVEVGPGFKAAGTLVTTNKGNSFAVVDQDTERSAVSSAISSRIKSIIQW